MRLSIYTIHDNYHEIAYTADGRYDVPDNTLDYLSGVLPCSFVSNDKIVATCNIAIIENTIEQYINTERNKHGMSFVIYSIIIIWLTMPLLVLIIMGIALALI